MVLRRPGAPPVHTEHTYRYPLHRLQNEIRQIVLRNPLADVRRQQIRLPRRLLGSQTTNFGIPGNLAAGLTPVLGNQPPKSDRLLAFEKQKIAYLVALTLAIGAFTNFPLLPLSIYWPGFTTRGAIVGGIVGLVTALARIALGPSVWVNVLGKEKAVFPEPCPALYSVVAGLAIMWLVLKLDHSDQGDTDRRKFSVMIGQN